MGIGEATWMLWEWWGGCGGGDAGMVKECNKKERESLKRRRLTLRDDAARRAQILSFAKIQGEVVLGEHKLVKDVEELEVEQGTGGAQAREGEEKLVVNGERKGDV